MKTTRAEVITAEEATWPKNEGAYIVSLYQTEDGQRTGHSWGVFQGTKKVCERLAEEVNKGLHYLE